VYQNDDLWDRDLLVQSSRHLVLRLPFREIIMDASFVEVFAEHRCLRQSFEINAKGLSAEFEGSSRRVAA
jgi:hypothetical protein